VVRAVVVLLPRDRGGPDRSGSLKTRTQLLISDYFNFKTIFFFSSFFLSVKINTAISHLFS